MRLNYIVSSKWDAKSSAPHVCCMGESVCFCAAIFLRFGTQVNLPKVIGGDGKAVFVKAKPVALSGSRHTLLCMRVTPEA